MFNIKEFLEEVDALITGKIPIGLGIGQAESLSEITDNSHDICTCLSIHCKCYENYFLLHVNVAICLC